MEMESLKLRAMTEFMIHKTASIFAFVDCLSPPICMNYPHWPNALSMATSLAAIVTIKYPLPNVKNKQFYPPGLSRVKASNQKCNYLGGCCTHWAFLRWFYTIAGYPANWHRTHLPLIGLQ